MIDFDFCVEHVFKREGGFVNHPADRGGPTNFGITKATLAAFRNCPVTDKDVFDLRREEAKDIYFVNYWQKAKLGDLPTWKLKLLLLDQAVHRGPARAVMALQEVLKIFFDPSVTIDGALGPNTIAAAMRADEGKLCRKYLQAVMRNYAQIAASDPKQNAFRVGWLNRAFALWVSIS